MVTVTILKRKYEELLEKYPDSFAMKKVSEAADIFPVFHELFERKPE